VSKPAGKGKKSGTGSSVFAKLWNERDRDGGIEKLIAEAEKAAEKDPENYEAEWQIARAAWWVADRSGDSEVKRRLGQKGYEHGARAIAINPDGVEGYTWFAAALGEYGLGISIVKALFQGLDGKFRKHCQQAIEIDAAYDGGAPLRAMGRFFAKLPFPKQDLRRSRELLEEAVKLAPERFLTRLYLAETLVALRKAEDALPHLETVLRNKPCAEDKADHEHYLSVAAEIARSVPGADALAKSPRK
jgi:tetratricopeptide (TPR) repeat protein